MYKSHREINPPNTTSGIGSKGLTSQTEPLNSTTDCASDHKSGYKPVASMSKWSVVFLPGNKPNQFQIIAFSHFCFKSVDYFHNVLT